jgi:hypothetical protein
MGILGVVAVVIVFVLWQILKTQRTRTEVEAARLASEVSRNFLDNFHRTHGTWAEAKKERRLIEYLDSLYESSIAAGVDPREARDDLRDRLSKKETKDLLKESMKRGKHSRFLEHDQYLYAFEPEYELDPFETERICASECEKSYVMRDSPVAVHLKSMGLDSGTRSQYIPISYGDECPFCGGPVEWAERGDRDQIAAEYRRGRKVWKRYKKLFPSEATKEEQRTQRFAREDEKTFEAVVAFYGQEHPD